MAVRFILMMALVMVASADPVPEPDIIVDVDQVVNAGAGCGGGCCDDDCHKKDSNGDLESCAIIKVENDGSRKYLGIVNACGECIVAAEPWVKTFDNMIDSYKTKWYRTNVGLESPTNNYAKYTLTQDGNSHSPSPSFEVIGSFYYSSEWVDQSKKHGDGSYVDGFTYREDNTDKIWGICKPGGGAEKNLYKPCETLNLWGRDGPIMAPFPKLVEKKIWVFEDVDGCIIIVGTKGLTVKVCPRVQLEIPMDDYYLPFVYMYASPTLSNSLYGLCNTYTGGIAEYYIVKSGWVPITRYNHCFPQTSQPTNIRYNIDTNCAGYVMSWKYP